MLNFQVFQSFFEYKVDFIAYCRHFLLFLGDAGGDRLMLRLKISKTIQIDWILPPIGGTTAETCEEKTINLHYFVLEQSAVERKLRLVFSRKIPVSKNAKAGTL